MTHLVNDIFASYFKDKCIEEKTRFYESLVSESNFETLQFFSMYDTALDEIVGSEICTKLYNVVLSNIKKNQSECAVHLFHQIMKKNLEKSLVLSMTATGWDLLKNTPKTCYDYIKLRNVKLCPTTKNICILNTIRKYNIHICDNHVLHWQRSKTLSLLINNIDENNCSEMTLFFSKLSNISVRLIITELQKNTNHICYPLLCCKNLDESDVCTLFSMYDMKKLFQREFQDYFAYINQNIYDKYFCTISPSASPYPTIVRRMNKYISTHKLTSVQINNIINFILFFYTTDERSEYMRREKIRHNENFVEILKQSIQYFSYDQQLKLPICIIENCKLEELCETYFDPIILHKMYADSHRKLFCNNGLAQSLFTSNVEAIKHINIWKYIMYSLNIEEEEEEEELYKRLPIELDTIINCINLLDDEKKNELCRQLLATYKTIHQSYLSKFLQCFNNNIIKDLYIKFINEKLLKFKLDASFVKIDTSIPTEEMFNIIFDISETEFGKCNICYESNVEYTCKTCGNCACTQCKNRMSRCAICREYSTFIKLHI